MLGKIEQSYILEPCRYSRVAAGGDTQMLRKHKDQSAVHAGEGRGRQVCPSCAGGWITSSIKPYDVGSI